MGRPGGEHNAKIKSQELYATDPDQTIDSIILLCDTDGTFRVCALSQQHQVRKRFTLLSQPKLMCLQALASDHWQELIDTLVRAGS